MRAGLALAILIGTTLSAFAGGGFDIVIPGRPGLPIIINGVDASYAVVEGEWGLAKSEQVPPTVYGGGYVDPVPHLGHSYPHPAPQPAQPEVPFYPPPVILAPQGGEDFARPPQDFDHRNIRKFPH